jgi:hypothetical protein
MLNYDDYVIVKMIKVKDQFGQFSHWVSETQFSDNWYKYEAEDIDFQSAKNKAFEHIKDVAQFWTAVGNE